MRRSRVAALPVVRIPSLPASTALPPAPLLTPLRFLRFLLGLALVTLALFVSGAADSAQTAIPPLVGFAPPGPPIDAFLSMQVDSTP